MMQKRLHSIRGSQWVSLFVVFTLVVLTVANGYIHRILQKSDSRSLSIMRLQNSFGELLSLEAMVLSGSEHYATFLSASQSLQIDIEADEENLDSGSIKERQFVFSKLLNTIEESKQYFENVTRALPELIDSVRSIHKYHIDSLKMKQVSGTSLNLLPADEEFQRSSIRSAPELDIITVAIEVQNNLLDVVALFSDMQQGEKIENIEVVFNDRIGRFYNSVNTFEDYSLDAQDGLVVEKLLITGKRFQESFNSLLQNFRRMDLLRLQLQENRNAVWNMLSKALTAQRQMRDKLRKHLDLIEQAIAVSSLLLTCWLLYYGLTISRQFARTARETRKIQNDLSYRIATDSSSYEEIKIIHETLNNLAETARNQVESLERMRGELTRRVQERTAELVHMNTRLKNEIADRVKADASRKDLENKLIRAKKMEAIGTLAGGVAHDLNNILSGVVSYPELILLDMEEDDPLYNMILTIKNSGEKAALIVQDLLTLARRGVAISEVVSVRELLGDYLKSPEFQHLQNEHENVEIVLEIDESCGNISGSRMHLQKTVMNLVTNGMEAMPEGGVLRLTSKSIYIDTQLKGYDTVNEGDYVVITVQDTGIGMTPEVIEHIFEPFYSQKKMGRSGTGLGMAVVYSTVKDHGGYIDIQSVPGKGSAISVYLPMTRELEKETTDRIELASIMAENEHVLIVDDVYEQRQIAASMLKRLNYTVATAAGGEEAVAYLKANEVDIVVLDMIMPPGLDGLDTYLAFQAVDPDIRVVIASGYSENDRVLKARELGVKKYIRKPYSLETLGAAIREILQAQRH